MKKFSYYLIFTTFILFSFYQKNLWSKEIKCDLIIKDKKFISGEIFVRQNPCTIELKADTKMRINICNQDNSIAEFESIELQVEKIIPANKSATVLIKPLKENKTYKFFEEFSGSECKIYVRN